MSALQQLSVNSQQLTGEQLAKQLEKDFASMKKTYDRHKEKNPSLPPLSKIEIVSDETREYLTELYSGQSTTDRQTTIRKLDTPQYEPPISREQIETEVKAQYKEEQKELKEKYEKQLQLEKQRTGSASAEQSQLQKQLDKAIADLRNLQDQVNLNQIKIDTLQSEKSDLETKLEEASKLDVHQRIAQLRTSIESEFQQKLILALEEAKTDAATDTAKITAEIAAKHTAEILKIKADAREQVKKEVNVTTQNLKREITQLDNIIRDKDFQIEKAYQEVGVDPTEDVPFTTETVKWASFTVIALAAAIIFSKFESTMFKALFDFNYENWLIYSCYFILAIVLQLLGVYISVNYNRKETEVLDPKTGKTKWVVTIEKYPIYVIVAMDIVVELVGFVWDFFSKNLESRFIIGAFVVAIILPTAHYFSSHIILEHLRKRIQERLNYGL